MAACGTSGLARYGDCGREGARGWQRRASAEEVAALHASGDLPPWEADALVVVVACAEEHVLDPELAARTHDATCRSPWGPGGCQACGT